MATAASRTLLVNLSVEVLWAPLSSVSRRTHTSIIGQVIAGKQVNAGVVIVGYYLRQSPSMASADGKQLCGGEGFTLANY